MPASAAWWCIEKRVEDALIAQVLSSRGLTMEELERPYGNGHDAALLPDFSRAVERLRRAIADGERVLICGDYDVDGVTGSAILYLALQAAGARVSVRLPSRFTEGYGLSMARIAEAEQLGVRVLVTVDNGTTATAELAEALRRGIDVVVTDHHHAPEVLPVAYAVVNPLRKDSVYPFTGICGSHIALKLAREFCADEAFLRYGTVLAGLATVADVMPLRGENHALVKEALRLLPSVAHAGLRRLCDIAGIEAGSDASVFGFRLGPRINAAGRMGDPMVALKLLIAAEDTGLADRLEALNTERKAETERLMEEVLRVPLVAPQVCIAVGEGWHHGIIGLAAGKAAESRHCVTVVGSKEKGLVTCSLRSPFPEVAPLPKLLDGVKDVLTKYGGHAAAAGCSFAEEMTEVFTERFARGVEECLRGADTRKKVYIDAEVGVHELTVANAEALARLSPFGAGHGEPLLLLSGVTLEQRTKLSGGKHTRFAVGGVSGIAFNEDALPLRADLVCTLQKNVWQGRVTPQILVKEWRECGEGG